MEIQDLPKVELHLHLDCSLSYGVVKKIRPGTSREQYRTQFMAPANCPDLTTYLSRAENAIDLMQSEKHLQWVVADVVDQLVKDGIIYAELRFAPLEHMRKGLSAERVVDTVCRAIEKGSRESGIHLGLLLCTLRHYSESMSLQVADLCRAFKDRGVIGMDIAGDEAAHGLDAHVAAFEKCHSSGIACTAHAGESMGYKSVEETIGRLKIQRIGHGVRAIENPETMALILSEDIHLEVCPTSNVLTGTVPSLDDHPVNRLYRGGVSLSINTDGRTISNVDLSREYKLLQKHFNWKKAEFFHCNIEAIKHSFVKEPIKQKLLDKINNAYKS